MRSRRGARVSIVSLFCVAALFGSKPTGTTSPADEAQRTGTPVSATPAWRLRSDANPRLIRREVSAPPGARQRDENPIAAASRPLDPTYERFARDELAQRRGRRPDENSPEARFEHVDARRLGILRASGALATSRERATPDGMKSLRLLAFKKGLRVFDRGGVASTREGEATELLGYEGVPPVAPGGWKAARIDRAGALRRAVAAAGVTRPSGEPRFERGFAVRDRATVPAWRVTLPSASPRAQFMVTLDARTGETLGVVDRMRGVTGTGRVHLKDPLLTPATSLVPLYDLDASHTLSGRYVRVVDSSQPPGPWTPVTPPLFDVPPGHRAFDLIALYRNLTDTARLAVDAGLRVTGDDPATLTVTETNAGEYGGPLLTLGFEEVDGAPSDNAGYEPGFVLDVPYVDAGGVRRTVERVADPPVLHFGAGDGIETVNLQTDSDVAAHELGHHIFEKLVDPLGVSGAPVSAMSEGLADAVAAIVEGDPHIGEAIFTPPTGRPWIRDLSAAATLPRPDDERDPHENGIVYGAVFWSLFGAFGQRDTMRLLIETMRDLPSAATPASFQTAIRTAESRLFHPSRRAAIDAALAARGFPGSGPPGFAGFLDSAQTTNGQYTRNGYRPAWNGSGARPEDVWIYYPNALSRAFMIHVVSTYGDVDVDIRPLNGSIPTLTSNLPGDDGAIVEENDVQWSYWNESTNTSEDRHYAKTDVVHTDDAWVISIYDYPDGPYLSSNYRLEVYEDVDEPLGVATPASPAAPVTSGLTYPGELKLFTMELLPCQILAVRARAAAGSGLDPMISVIDLESGELLAADDDSGDLDPSTSEDDLDAFVRGTLVPRTPVPDGTGRHRSPSCTQSPAQPGLPYGSTVRRIGVGVQAFSTSGIVRAGDPPPPGMTGGFTINAGVAPIRSVSLGSDSRWSFTDLADAPMPNADGDERPDEFDDDADQDLVPDEDDESPLDPRGCFDRDLDGCDDCAMRTVPTPAGQEPSLPNPLNDGPDRDADGVCDVSDVDAENDGVPAAQDNCPLVSNPSQADSDHDGVGDACDLADSDADGLLDWQDNCPFEPNPAQTDTGGIGTGSPPDGIGNACQCGDVNGDGQVTIADATLISRSLLIPPVASLAQPALCDAGGSAGCTTADATIVKRALLLPPTATIQQVCAPARP